MPFWCLKFSPKNEQKQVNLRFHISEVEFFCSFFGGIVYIWTWKNHFDFFWPLQSCKIGRIWNPECEFKIILVQVCSGGGGNKVARWSLIDIRTRYYAQFCVSPSHQLDGATVSTTHSILFFNWNSLLVRFRLWDFQLINF